MKNEKLLNALDKVDERFIIASSPDNSKNSKNIKGSAWVKWGAVAACLCLIVGGVVWGIKSFSIENETSNYVVTEDGITILPMEVTLSKNDGAAFDMMAFFIYEGRCYVQYQDSFEDKGIVGEYLGTATGMIDEWTKEEGYVNFAGSICGDFYTVNGYDPEFMLCIKNIDGTVSTYICNSGITLKYGRELYEHRMRMSEYVIGVQYESRKSWHQSMGEVYELDMTAEYIQDFISQLNAEKFILCRDVEEQEEWGSMIDYEIYHLYFTMNNGMRIHLRLYENGYVRFEGLMGLCVKLPEDGYGELIDILTQNIGTPVESK